MTEWTQYKRKGLSEMMPWTPEIGKQGFSISEQDHDAGSPKIGDMIARNPNNHSDRWLVAEKYFIENLEPSDAFEITPTRAQRFVRHIAGHLDAGDIVVCKICGKSIDQICKDK